MFLWVNLCHFPGHMAQLSYFIFLLPFLQFRAMSLSFPDCQDNTSTFHISNKVIFQAVIYIIDFGGPFLQWNWLKLPKIKSLHLKNKYFFLHLLLYHRGWVLNFLCGVLLILFGYIKPPLNFWDKNHLWDACRYSLPLYCWRFSHPY